MTHNGSFSCLVINMGNFLLRVVSGILPAVFFKDLFTHFYDF